MPIITTVFSLITGFLLTITGWLVKKFGISKLVMAFEIAISIAYITFVLSAVTFIMLFVFKLWNLFKLVFSSLSTVPAVSGGFNGLANSTIVSSFFGFLEESGISDAFITAGDLFIGLVSIFFTIQAYKITIFAVKEIKTIISTLLDLMSR